MKIKSLDWFKKRVGKKIYRDSNHCSCSTCSDVLENGIFIYNENHAEYLYNVMNDYGCDGINLNYRDKK